MIEIPIKLYQFVLYIILLLKPILSQKLKVASSKEQEKDSVRISQHDNDKSTVDCVASPTVMPSPPLEDSTDILARQCDEILQMIER